MTKKHFVKIAAILREHMDSAPDVYEADRVKRIAQDLSAEFRQINPNFDPVKFLKACGVIF